VSRFGYLPLVVYEVTASAMGEACSFRVYEWRTADLRAISRLLGSTVVDLDEHHERASTADRACCPFCRRAGDAVPARVAPAREGQRRSDGDPHPWLSGPRMATVTGVSPPPRTIPAGAIPAMVAGAAVHAA
jgi:hypothetical protein